MKFKILLLFFLFGCGIKGPPVSDKETIIPSYIEKFTESQKE